MIQYLQLVKHFDGPTMQAEVNQLLDDWWKEHYNKKNYEGGWSIIPLRAVGGNPENLFSIHSSANEALQYSDTPLLEQCPYLKKVLDFFECEKTSVRLMKLNAGAIIKEHADQDMSFEEGEVRFHIPVQTNDKVSFYIQDDKVPMKEGECWYLNLTLKHRVCNEGASDRIHLVVDCLVNDWVKIFFKEQYKVKKEIHEDEIVPRHTAEEKNRVIQQLRMMNTTIGNELADKMEAEL